MHEWCLFEELGRMRKLESPSVLAINLDVLPAKTGGGIIFLSLFLKGLRKAGGGNGGFATFSAFKRPRFVILVNWIEIFSSIEYLI